MVGILQTRLILCFQHPNQPRLRRKNIDLEKAVRKKLRKRVLEETNHDVLNEIRAELGIPFQLGISLEELRQQLLQHIGQLKTEEQTAMTATMDPPAEEVDVVVKPERNDALTVAAFALIAAIIALVIGLVAINKDSGMSSNDVENTVNQIVDVREFTACKAEVVADNEVYGTKLVPEEVCSK